VLENQQSLFQSSSQVKSVSLKILSPERRQFGKIQGSKIIINSLGAADRNHFAIFPQQQLCRTEFAVIIKSHGVTMRSRIMDGNNVVSLQFW